VALLKHFDYTPDQADTVRFKPGNQSLSPPAAQATKPSVALRRQSAPHHVELLASQSDCLLRDVLGQGRA
jgi:hypothetical protein